MVLGRKDKVRLGITGADGLIGSHVRTFFYKQPGFDIACANRDIMADDKAFASFVNGCDVIVHCAGMNRGDEDEIFRTNVALTDRLIAACDGKNSATHIFFPSSVHISRETAYGRSKRVCAENLNAWSVRSKGSFTNMILPNVFGEEGKPFYNSVVSTFCYQLAQGQEPKIIHDQEIELLHVISVARFILEAIHQRTVGEVRLKGIPYRVGDLLKNLRSLADLYANNIIPDLRIRIDLELFNTLRSYWSLERCLGDFSTNEDLRGGLTEVVKSHSGGQCFLSHTKPGIVRGNHYHLEKFERFAVIAGKAVIRLRKLFTAEITAFEVSGDKTQYVDIPTMCTHHIENTGPGDLITLFWANELYDPKYPDTFAETV